MERAVKAGKLRSIGLSNYYDPEDFDRLVNATEIVPALLQNETHPYYQSGEMKAHIAQYGTVMESWFPLGGRGNTQILFNDPVISGIADAHGKTSAQVILRWHSSVDECQRRKFSAKNPEDMLKLGSVASMGLPKYLLK